MPINRSFSGRNRGVDNPAWGIRHLNDVSAAAAHAGLRLSQRHALPANNLLLVFERGASAPAA